MHNGWFRIFITPVLLQAVEINSHLCRLPKIGSKASMHASGMVNRKLFTRFPLNRLVWIPWSAAMKDEATVLKARKSFLAWKFSGFTIEFHCLLIHCCLIRKPIIFIVRRESTQGVKSVQRRLHSTQHVLSTSFDPVFWGEVRGSTRRTSLPGIFRR